MPSPGASTRWRGCGRRSPRPRPTSSSASASTPATRMPPARLGGAIPPAEADVMPGFFCAACHALAAGEEREGAVERVLAVVGRIDLLHANASRHPPGTGAARHANLGDGQMSPEALRAMIGAAGPPVVIETPGDADAMRADIAFVRDALARG